MHPFLYHVLWVGFWAVVGVVFGMICSSLGLPWLLAVGLYVLAIASLSYALADQEQKGTEQKT